jgi:adenine/guanine phosphoribosyltransferase-like PRPP-binding protein
MALVLRDSPRVTAILRKCYSHVEVADRERNRGTGVTNLKRLFGRPDDLRVVVEALAATVGRADALASADTGGAPLAAVVAYQLGLPAVFVREVPKEHLLSYGGDPATNHPRLAGERLRPGSTIHLIDDLVHSGETLGRAARTLREAELEVRLASCLLIAPETTGWPDNVATAGIDEITAMTTTLKL